MATVEGTKPVVNDKREIFGWAMYDWANSAFSTTIGTVFLGPYVSGLARNAAIAAGTETASFLGIPIAPDSVLLFAISFSVVFQAGFLPILGAIADYSHRRKQMLQLFAVVGALTTIGMFFIQENLWGLGPILFIIANLAFGAAIVFYNAYLPDIASEDERDRVSSYGWAMGYLGGGILLALNLVFFMVYENFGISESMAVRINLASAGLWWFGFSFITWTRLHPRQATKELPEGENIFSIAFKQLSETMEAPAKLIAVLLLSPFAMFVWAPLIAPFVVHLQMVRGWPDELAFLPLFVPLFGPIIMLVIFLRQKARTLPETSKFLTSYLIYNDGIQTVIAVTAIFAAAPLIQGGLEMDTQTLIFLILMIQFVAFFGALIWGKLAKWIGAKQAVIVSLVIWAGAVTFAYFGLRGETRVAQTFILGIFIALVMGGSQAISRSIFAQMIPKRKEAEFFSIYEISERGTSWLGPFLFAFVNQTVGNLRPAILSLIFFFVVGLLILPFVKVDKAIADVKKYDAARS